MTSQFPPYPANWTTRQVGRDEELQCDRCMQRMRPGRTAYVADHSGDEFPHVAVYCSVACRHFAERANTTYLHDDGAALAAARARAGDGYIHDLDEAYEVQGHVTALTQELPRLRERINALRAKADADGVHRDLAQVYKKDAQDLEALAECAADGHYIAAAMIANRFDTAVRDEVGQRLYDAIGALAADQEPAGIDEQVLFDALKDNLSPMAVAAIVAYLQPAQTKNAEVDRQLRWLSDRLTGLVGGPEQLDRLMDELGL